MRIVNTKLLLTNPETCLEIAKKKMNTLICKNSKRHINKIDKIWTAIYLEQYI